MMRFSSSALAALLVAVLCLCCVVPSSLAARTAVLQVSSVLFLCVERHELPFPTLPRRKSGLE